MIEAYLSRKVYLCCAKITHLSFVKKDDIDKAIEIYYRNMVHCPVVKKDDLDKIPGDQKTPPLCVFINS
jgi:hypothetical protein